MNKYILKEETSGAYFKSVDEYTFVEKEAKRFESLGCHKMARNYETKFN